MHMVSQRFGEVNLGTTVPGGLPVNFNFVAESSLSKVITGSSGTGKTNAGKYLINQYAGQGVSCLILDCHGDLYCRNVESVYLSDGPNGEASLRPLGFSASARDKYGDDGIADIVIQVIEASGRALGASQEAVLRKAVKMALRKGDSLEDVKECLEELKDKYEIKKEKAVAESAIARLERISERNVFSHEVGFSPSDMAEKSIRFDLSGLSGVTRGPVMNMILSLVFHEIMANGEVDKWSPPGPARIRKMIFVDEAKIVLDACAKQRNAENPLEEIVRQGRKFGVGLMVSSQSISDFSTDMTNNVGCSLAMNSFDAKERKRVVDRFGVAPEMAHGWPKGVALARLSSGGCGFLRIPQVF